MGNVRSHLRITRALSSPSSLHHNTLPAEVGPTRHLLKGAFAGKAEAQYRLGRFYDEGTGVTPEWATAIMWFRKSADSGYLPAILRLGQLLLEQRGEMPNSCQGLFWLLKAARRGSAEACAFLGHARLAGGGLPQSDTLAVKWFLKGSDLGCPRSMMGLAFCFMNGRAVPRDTITGHALLAAATARGFNAKSQRIERRIRLDEKTLGQVEDLSSRIQRHGVRRVKEVWDSAILAGLA